MSTAISINKRLGMTNPELVAIGKVAAANSHYWHDRQHSINCQVSERLRRSGEGAAKLLKIQLEQELEVIKLGVKLAEVKAENERRKRTLVAFANLQAALSRATSQRLRDVSRAKGRGFFANTETPTSKTEQGDARLAFLREIWPRLSERTQLHLEGLIQQSANPGSIDRPKSGMALVEHLWPFLPQGIQEGIHGLLNGAGGG